jgi:hypothetical protein
MKGMALHDRIKEKDAFDIYYAVRNAPGGVDSLAEDFRPHLTKRLVQEGLRKIRSKFGSVDAIGPKCVVDFLELQDPEERALGMRDAYVTVSRLLDNLRVEAWDKP